MTITQTISAAQLLRLVEGDEDDWVPIVKAKSGQTEGTVIVSIQTLDGRHVEDIAMRAGDKLSFDYEVSP